MRAKPQDSGARPRELRTTIPDGPKIPARCHRYSRRDPRLDACAQNGGGTRPRALSRPRHAQRRPSGFSPLSCRLSLLLLGRSRSLGPACFSPPGPPPSAPVPCASTTSAEGGGSMLSPQRTAAAASRGAGEASTFPWTRSVVTHAASQCSGSEVTTCPCRRPASCGDGGCSAGCLRSEFGARGSWSGRWPRAGHRVLWPVELRPVHCRACRAAALSGAGKPEPKACHS